VRQAIRLLLESPELAGSVDQDQLNGLNMAGIPLLVSLVELVKENPNITCGGILEHWRGMQEGAHLAKLAKMPITIPEDGIESEFIDIIDWLKKRRRTQRVDELISKSQQGPLSLEEKDELNQALAAK
jgi:DNA primase